MEVDNLDDEVKMNEDRLKDMIRDVREEAFERAHMYDN